MRILKCSLKSSLESFQNPANIILTRVNLSSNLTRKILRSKVDPLENHLMTLKKTETVNFPAIFCYPELQLPDFQQQINEMFSFPFNSKVISNYIAMMTEIKLNLIIIDNDHKTYTKKIKFLFRNIYEEIPQKKYWMRKPKKTTSK